VLVHVKDGERLYIETRRGKIKQKAKVSERIPHRVWESNANVLCPDDPDFCDPLTGGWQSRALLCKVYKA
jgi:anaerobic selenocysteine-containing dehydrogenase